MVISEKYVIYVYDFGDMPEKCLYIEVLENVRHGVIAYQREFTDPIEARRVYDLFMETGNVDVLPGNTEYDTFGGPSECIIAMNDHIADYHEITHLGLTMFKDLLS